MCFMCIKDPSNTVLGGTDSRRIYDGQIKLRDKYSDDGFHFVTSKSIGARINYLWDGKYGGSIYLSGEIRESME